MLYCTLCVHCLFSSVVQGTGGRLQAILYHSYRHIYNTGILHTLTVQSIGEEGEGKQVKKKFGSYLASWSQQTQTLEFHLFGEEEEKMKNDSWCQAVMRGAL